jgi:hypothetical protein
MIANILKAKRRLMVTKGSKIRLCLIPGIHKVLLVISKLVKETVELIPANTTDSSNKSCEPTPVYFTFDEKGVINVQPAVVKTLLEHLVKYTFFLLYLVILLAKYQKDSG